MPDADDLFRRARAGDPQAFWSLVLPHRGLIYSVASGILRDRERAEEALHDVLLLAFRSLPNLRDPGRFTAWLYGLTRNHISETQRREKRVREAAEESARLPARVVPIAELREREDWHRQMEEALGQLPEPFRVVLHLKYFNEYSCREMAAILEVPETTVKSRLFEARKLLRRLTGEIGRRRADAAEKEAHHEMH